MLATSCGTICWRNLQMHQTPEQSSVEKANTESYLHVDPSNPHILKLWCPILATPLHALINLGGFLCHPPINYTAFINTGLMNGPCKKGELRGGVNTAPACTHVATY